MRFMYTILPLLSAVALAQNQIGDKCQCPQVKCPSDDPVALCKCLNGRESMCVERCPKYKPTFVPCPVKPTPPPTKTPKPVPTPKPTKKPVTCECLQINCIQVWPQSCHCANGAKQRCYDDCGGEVPELQECPPIEEPITARAAEPAPEVKPAPTPKPVPVVKLPVKPKTCECLKVNCLQVWPGSCHCANDAKKRCYEECGGAPPQLDNCPDEAVVARAPAPEPEPEANCVCEEVFCLQIWPEGCYCANAAAEQCHKKCGGKKPALQSCPPLPSSTLTTKTKPTPKPSPKPTPLPPNPHPVCGGGRGNYKSCEPGYACITDPYTGGCGPACDALGICVKDKICGGFAGFDCEEKGQVCHDDPRDDCDVKSGGADCGGLCVWPHKSLTEE